MPLFELNSEITIGTFTFKGVHEVRIRRGIHSILDTATISLPSICKIKQGKSASGDIKTTGSLFSDRDPVTIKLGYNGDMKEEFRGFVKRRDLGMPLVVECEGYYQQLKLDVAVKKNYKSTTAKELLLEACKSTDIKVKCPVDFPISGIKLNEADGVRICDWIKAASDHALTLFFIEPDVLFCGLTYSAYAEDSTANMFGLPTVNYRLGYNVVKDNALRERIPSEPVQIICNGKLASGNVVMTESKEKVAKRKVKALLNHVPDQATMQKFAQEKAYQMNYTGYEGRISGFLQPYALPGYDAYVTDSRYPERNGVYLIESTEVHFGQQGARRIVELGPKVGFDK